ncbi:MAG: ribosome biogenesis GTPase Der [Brevibacterium yomogidense]|uniref:GTPase Der n=1 Tax=Brevibacterium yomogidense TaxID=946573 RepID=A0A1X6XFK9_9MICO|nr:MULTISPECIES: ribosome biogenesis GTPase Der [Brevibacterium]SLM97893.1 GTP-binding protein EngA [Brevibacterium yomogidense]SMX68391.1 GTP-binding protein [Brevibacterium sp. Mu109]
MSDDMSDDMRDDQDDFTPTPDEDFADRVAGIDEEEAAQRAASLRSGLEAYDLEEDDLELLDAYESDAQATALVRPAPVLAIVGRPNVGKSTLVNRILGRREAVVEDVPGVTRDRVRYGAEWGGRPLTLVDTGGWDIDVRGMSSRIAGQAEIAVSQSDAVLLVVDVTTGVTSTDEHVVRMLRRAGKPVILTANKVDDERGEIQAAELWALGLGEPRTVSAMHGRGVADLLDVIMETLPEFSEVDDAEEPGGPRRIALVGRPNVGKSSLLNHLAKEERVIVDNVAGTTRDPVDQVVELGGKPWKFVDTAGIKKRARQASGADYYASLRTQTALERAELALVLLEANEPLSEQDIRIVRSATEAGRALVLAFNKWDLVDEERRHWLGREIEKDLAHVEWAPRVNISAKTGRHADKLVPAMEHALKSWDMRIPTSRLNAFLGELVAANPHPVRGGKQPRILFGTQVSSRPPHIVVFTTGFLDPGYRRFILRRLRETFDFTGTPIQLGMRIREKRKRR